MVGVEFDPGLVFLIGVVVVIARIACNVPFFERPRPDVYWVEYENGAIAVWLGFMWRSSLQGTKYMHLPSLLYIPGYGWIRCYADMWRDEHIPQVMESKGFDYMDAELNLPLVQSYVESNLRTIQKTISAYTVGGKVRKVKYRP